MNIQELVTKNRSYRRFHQDQAISTEILKELVDLARLSPSAQNKQPLKFILSNTPEKNNLVFSTLKWAGFLTGWNGPEQGERPAAYIIILGDTSIKQPVKWDDAIAAQSILLGAVAKGFGGCILGSIDKPALRESLQIPEIYDTLLVIALGKPRETVQIDPVGQDGDTRYWRDRNDVHHVPKRNLDDVIVGF